MQPYISCTMSRKKKLLQRLLSNPKDFRWEELVTIMRDFGYTEELPGKTGGSRRRFTKDGKAITFHKPHPSGILKPYQIRIVLESLKQEGLI